MHSQFRRGAPPDVTRLGRTGHPGGVFERGQGAIGAHTEYVGVVDRPLIDTAGGDQQVAVGESAGQVPLGPGQQAARMESPTGGGQHHAQSLLVGHQRLSRRDRRRDHRRR